MKKLIVLVIVSTIGLNVLNAQTFFQGEKAIAASVSNLGLDLIKFNGESTKANFNLGLKGDYFIIDNLTVTAGGGYSIINKDNYLWGEIGSKYYFWECLYGGIFYQGVFDYGRLSSRGKIEVGASLYIADNVFIEPSIYFLRGEAAGANKTVEMFSQFGIALSFGVNF